MDLTWGLVLFSLRGPRCFGLVSLAVHFKGINKSLPVGGRAKQMFNADTSQGPGEHVSRIN